MKDFSFRRAVLADLPGIVVMLADNDLGRQREDSSGPEIQKFIDSFAAIDIDPNQMLAVVETEGALVGCLQLTFVPGLSQLGMWRGQIESVCIANGNRGKRPGRNMIEWAITECRRRGCGLVQLTTDRSRVEAYQFYESLGFVASHEGMKLDL